MLIMARGDEHSVVSAPPMAATEERIEPWLNAANEAVSLHAAAVVFHAVTPQAASGAYAALQSAGIPVVTGYPGVPSTVKYSVDVNWTKVGQLEAVRVDVAQPLGVERGARLGQGDEAPQAFRLECSQT